MAVQKVCTIKKVRIVSDGTAQGTRVLDANGKESLPFVTAIDISIRPDGLVSAKIEIHNVELEISAAAKIESV